MLDSTLKEQVRGILSGLEADYLLDVFVSPKHEQRDELLALLNDLTACSPKITVRIHEGDDLYFSLIKEGQDTGISFRGVPTGHEFSSLLLAVLNSDGKGKNIPDEGLRKRVRHLRGPIRLTTYISLTCPKCPDVVQMLNMMVTLNPQIRHEMVDGALHREAVDVLKIQMVPSVFADGKRLHVGSASFNELLEKLEAQYGTTHEPAQQEPKHYDVLVAGGGPAGTTAAIYSARKGLKVGLVAEHIGGQLKETVGIENLISVPYITGAALTENLKEHLGRYPVEIFADRRIEKLELKGKERILVAGGGERFSAPALIIATGAGWRRLNIPGEAEYIGKGVAFCPHCDGPFYKGKHVAVIGGGNSGVEAAIDLAGICSKVTVLEYLNELKADQILQKKAKELSNIEVFTGIQTLEITGSGAYVTGIRIKVRETGEERNMALDGVFVQIGLQPNSNVFKETVKTTERGEVLIDTHCRTSVPGIYAAGDVTSVPYKQIVIALGEGAKAALAAFEDRIRTEE